MSDDNPKCHLLCEKVYVILEQLPNGVSVISEDGSGREGFIPHSYCAPFGSPLADMALSANSNPNSGGGKGGGGGGGGRERGSSRHQQQNNCSVGRGGMMVGGGDEHLTFAPSPHSPFDDRSSGSVSTVPFYRSE